MERYPLTLWTFLEGQNLELSERLEIAIKLVKEVGKAHDGLVGHRDLKPTNIMLDKNKELVLVDFGIGREFTDLKGSCGTPGFNAPEHFFCRQTRFSRGHFQSRKKLGFGILQMGNWVDFAMVA